MRALNIVLYLDGRPGHEKQSRGIIKALEKYCSVLVTEVEVEKRTFLQEIIAYFSFYLHWDVSFCKDTKIDLVIGSGSGTHISILLCKRVSRARAVTCMTPSNLLKSHFDLCFVPIHDRPAEVANMFPTLGPPNISTIDKRQDQRKSLILVGGVDLDSHIWNQEKLEYCIRKLLEGCKAEIWTISSSPRTPGYTNDVLESIAAAYVNVEFYPYSETEPGWIEEQYATNKTVWVTGDSISMVYEALSAGCNVGILPVEWKKSNNKFHFSEQYLIKHKRVVSFAEWQAGTAHWVKQDPLNEADRCAKEILSRWWPNN